MKHRIHAFLACAFAVLLPVIAHAEEWVYTGSYPYVYKYSTDSWIYVPENPPMVWDYTAGDWTENPLGGRSFNIQEIFDIYPLQLDMTVDGSSDVTMQILFNFSGVDTSVVSCTKAGETFESGDVYTCHSIDTCAGTCLMLGSFSTGDNFSLQLDFSTGTTGTYKMIGIFPFMAYTANICNHLSTISGTFTLGECEEE